MNKMLEAAACAKVSGRGRIRVPAETVLTARVITTAAQRLAASELADVIESLIGEMDRRSGDPDFEPEPLEEDF
jgi:hypothetical protein